MAVEINGVSYSWTQPVCDPCYLSAEPERIPVRIHETMRSNERCCFCGDDTRSGIYYRVDPRECGYPTPEDSTDS